MGRRGKYHALLLTVLVTACATGTASHPPAASVEMTERHAAPLDSQLSHNSDPYVDAWIVDVGQGLCVYVDCPDDVRPLLVDCGTKSWSSRNTATTVSRWINSHAAQSHPMAVAVSHPHVDHYSVLPRIERSNVESLTLGGNRQSYPANVIALGGGSSRSFSGSAPHLNDTVLSCGTRTHVDILTVNAHVRAKPENGDSIVLAIRFNDTAIILPGDAEDSTEAAALATIRSPDYHLPSQVVLVSAHHGSSTEGSNGEDWIRALRPQAMIFSANPEYRTYSHPRCDILDRAAPLVALATTQSQITCDVDTVRAHAPRPYRSSARLLATYDNGTMRVRLTGAGISIACEHMTAACQAQLTGDQLPAGVTS